MVAGAVFGIGSWAARGVGGWLLGRAASAVTTTAVIGGAGYLAYREGKRQIVGESDDRLTVPFNYARDWSGRESGFWASVGSFFAYMARTMEEWGWHGAANMFKRWTVWACEDVKGGVEQGYRLSSSVAASLSPEEQAEYSQIIHPDTGHAVGPEEREPEPAFDQG